MEASVPIRSSGLCVAHRLGSLIPLGVDVTPSLGRGLALSGIDAGGDDLGVPLFLPPADDLEGVVPLRLGHAGVREDLV